MLDNKWREKSVYSGGQKYRTASLVITQQNLTHVIL